MGRIEARLGTLEDHAREGAAVEVRRAWEGLTIKELALNLAPFYFGREPTPEEVAAQEKFRAAVPEALVARAIGYREDLAEEEVSRRLGELVRPVVAARRSRLLREFSGRGFP